MSKQIAAIMGADGNIYILDAAIVEQNGYDPYADFASAYPQTIFGRQIWTVYYSDSMELYRYPYSWSNPPDRTIEDYEAIGAVIDEWEVWT